uniref:U2AF homology motif (UHM) kinase 1 n=1 Tax=Gasterosteus aculeatus aculeatus TaxID=481459 RepID=A0AAQ4QQT4_GASAC
MRNDTAGAELASSSSLQLTVFGDFKTCGFKQGPLVVVLRARTAVQDRRFLPNVQKHHLVLLTFPSSGLLTRPFSRFRFADLTSRCRTAEAVLLNHVILRCPAHDKVTLYGVFTNHSRVGAATRCLLLELLDVSVSDLLVRSTGGTGPQRGHSLWLVQHCARDVLEALTFLHREGYVHADLKPRNILWSADDECFKLVDFGLSFKEGNQDVKYIQTDGYRAPEAELQNGLAQAGVELDGDSGCTAAVDMWSLGIVLLEMFSGIKLKDTVRSQKWKDNSAAIVDQLFATNSAARPAIPVYHLRDLIKSMLLSEPKQRCTTETALLSPFFSIPFAPHIEDLVLLPTPVLRLLNLIDDSHLHNEEEYEDILEDMKEECQKYGSVVSLLIPKENPGKGQVFVEYANSSDSKEAQRLLTGRTFDGKFVVATFYPLSAYRRGYLYQTVQ